MKYFVPLMLLMSLINLLACRDTVRQAFPSEKKLGQMLDSCPDSLALWLEENVDPAGLPDSVEASFWWWLTQAHLKSQRNLINDSLVNKSVSYYEKSHSPRLPKAYYLAAHQLNWSGQNKEAQIELLLKAESVAKTLQDTAVLMDTYISLGALYERRREYQNALDVNRKLHELSDGWWQVMSLYRIGYAYMSLGNTDSACYYTERSIGLAEEREYEIVPFLMRNYADYLSTLGQFDKARSIIEDIFRRFPEERNGDSLFSFTNILIELNRVEEAEIYLNRFDSIMAIYPSEQVISGKYISIILHLLVDAKAGRPVNAARFG